MKTTSKCQITQPLTLRRKHGIGPRDEVEIVDHADGILVRRPKGRKPGQYILEQMRHGTRIEGTTDEILKLTRGHR